METFITSKSQAKLHLKPFRGHVFLSPTHFPASLLLLVGFWNVGHLQWHDLIRRCNLKERKKSSEMVDLKQRKVVLSFYVFGNSFLTEVILLLPPSYTICKAQKRKVEMSSGAAGNDGFMMITEGVRVSFTSLTWLCGAASWQRSDETCEGEVLVRLIQSSAHSRE